jgi:hypothetical protein
VTDIGPDVRDILTALIEASCAFQQGHDPRGRRALDSADALLKKLRKRMRPAKAFPKTLGPRLRGGERK